MLYLIYKVGITLAKMLPLRICYFLADIIARFYYIFSSEDKKGLAYNLKIVLGDNISRDKIKRHSLTVLRNFAKYLCDFFKFPRLTKKYISSIVDIKGIQHLDKCFERGRGVIALSMHLGNWELGGAVLGALGYDISAIVLEHSDRKINDFFVNQRSINGLKSIPLGFRMKECFRVLRRNAILAIAGDKNYTPGGIEIEFFKKKCIIPVGAAVLSLKTGAPIVFTALTREKNDRFRLSFEEPIYPEVLSDDYEENVKMMINRYVAYFEKYVRMYPDQWYVFRKLWNQE